MIDRIWHGWTPHEKADAYERLLREEVFLGIAQRSTKGYRGIRLLRRELATETEFITIMTFESLDAVVAFAGQDYTRCVVPPAARALLTRFDEHSQHYQVIGD